MKQSLLSIIAILMASALCAQKPPLDHSVYDSWKSHTAVTIPNYGDWAYYTVKPQEGDSTLEIFNIKSGKKQSIERGSAAYISTDGTKLVFRLSPSFSQKRQAKIEKKKSDQMPKDTLGIMDLNSGIITKYPELQTLAVPEKLKEHIAFKTSSKPDSLKKSDKNSLYILNINTLAIDTIKSVQTFSFSKDGERIAYVTKPGKKDTLVKAGIFIYEPLTRNNITALIGNKKSAFGSFSFNDKGDKLTFYAALDTTGNSKNSTSIYIYSNGNTKEIVPNNAENIPQGWRINNKENISFRNNDSYILFALQPIPREKDTTLVDFEQPKLDVWTWNEKYLPTVQKSIKRSYPAIKYLNDQSKRIIQIGDEKMYNVGIGKENVQDYILVANREPYEIQTQWDSNPISDIYKVSLTDGSRELLFKGARFSSFSISPDGAYYTMYNPEEEDWYLYTLSTGTLTNLTSNLGVVFKDEDHDRPALPSSYGSAIWREDSKAFFIPDRFDLWQFDPSGEVAPFTITEGKGRATNTRYSSVNPYFEAGKTQARFVTIHSNKPLYFSTFNYSTKMTGFAMKDVTKKRAKLEKLVEGGYTYDNISILKGKKPVYIYSKGNFESGNNLWMTTDNFKSETQLSDINPQQREYNWGTVELVSWKTKEGIDAEGLLYKPENFDPSKKYPLLIYFYEKNSQGLYSPRNPAPSRSTINIPFFVSNEYIVFVPDIYYTEGHPGKSAMNSIMPACDMLCKNSWIDSSNMAIQGQSWGGYQVAYMITQTDRFKAAGAGAPVSNMTSAYGGIRWESGRVRQMQYEHGQSRIGKTLWDGLDLYIENSPIFFVPNVKTPVLIMHNDADGAVPWWQGIEFFTALKRCGKQAWMLQYNNEEHNLRERRNAKDLSIRLEQFFNHFLKGAPMPVWMKNGIPYQLKGIDLGYELSQED